MKTDQQRSTSKAIPKFHVYVQTLFIKNNLQRPYSILFIVTFKMLPILLKIFNNVFLNIVIMVGILKTIFLRKINKKIIYIKIFF